MKMVHNLRDDLRGYYKKTRLKRPTEDWPPHQPKSVISVALIHYSDGRTDQELIEISQRFKEGAPAVDKLVSSHSRVTKDVSKIFAADPRDQTIPNDSYTTLPKCILIEGAPGIGKTVLTKEIAYLWADGKLLKSYDLVFLVYLRDPRLCKINSVKEIVQLFCTEKVTTHITTYLNESNGRKAAFLFDGFDEFPASLQKSSFIADLIKGNISVGLTLFESIVVVTSRPTATLFLHDVVDRRIEILGFAKEEREEYIFVSLKDSSKQGKLNKYLKLHPIINGLCFIPLHLAILLYLFKRDSLPETFTEMNEFFVVHTIYRHLSKSNPSDQPTVKKLTDFPKDIFEFVQKLSKLAFDGLQNDRLVFSYDEIKKVCPEIETTSGTINGFGLLQAVQHYVKEGAGKTTSFNFLHFTMQEYLAALHVSTLPGDQQLSMMKETFWESHYMFMWIMYVGIIGIKSTTFDSFVHSKTCGVILSRSKTDKISLSQNTKMKYLHLFQCYAEAKSNIIPEEISSIFSSGIIKFTGTTLLPHHISSLMLFMSASSMQQWISLELQNCNLRNIGMDSLLEYVIKNEENVSTLKYVDLNRNGSSPWSVYCAIIRHCCVNNLTLCGDDGMEKYVEDITDSLHSNKSLQSLTLCSIGSIGLKVVKNYSFSSATLHEVSLSWKKILLKDSNFIRLPCTQLQFDGEKKGIRFAFINILYNSNHECSSTIINLSDETISDEAVMFLSFGLSNNTTVQALNISSSRISSDGIVIFCGCFKENSVLQELDLSHLSITIEVVNAIADMINNTRLVKLNISGSGICDNGITVISSVLTNNNTLQELILSRNNITIEGARNIADVVQKNTTLQKLDISYCNIHSKGALIISKSAKSNKTLRELIMSWRKDQVTVNTTDQFWDLHNNKIENIGMLIVSQLLYDNMKVVKLNTSFNEITDDGVVAICNFLSSNNALQELDISHNQITIKGASNIAQVLQVNTTLRRLDISYCSIPNEGMIAISDHLKSNNVLQEFYCRYNNITVEGANTIAELIQLSTRLKAIDISYCGITVKGAVIISKSCKHNKILQKVILSWIDIENITAKQKEGHTVNTSVQDCELTGLNIGNSGALIISNLLFNNITTKKLDISLNDISDISAICDCLKTNSKLQELNLSYNKINIESTAKIAEVIEHNITLQKLNISNCNIPGDRMDAISDSLRNNVTLQELNMSHNNIMFEGASKIAEVILVNAMLLKLDISSCHIPDDGVVVVSESYKNNKTLQELIISWNNDQVTVNTADPICDLSSKNIDNSGGLIVSNLLYNNQMIRRVDLSFNNLCDDGTAAISNCLRNNSTLEELNLSNNNITTKGIQMLFNALLLNETLKTLNISSNNICDDGAVIISEYLRKKGTLETLLVVGISKEGRKIIWNAQIKKYKCMVFYNYSNVEK